MTALKQKFVNVTFGSKAAFCFLSIFPQINAWVIQIVTKAKRDFLNFLYTQSVEVGMGCRWLAMCPGGG